MGKVAGKKVLVVRAGATEWDRCERLQGACDLPLCDAARDELLRTVAGLGKLSLSTVFCAPDEASVETARLLAGVSGGKVSVVPEMAEINFGLWEGLRTQEIEERYCRAARQWLEDPSSVTPPQGETVEAFQERLFPAVERAISKSRARAGIGIVLRPVALGLLRCALNRLPTAELWSLIKERPVAEWYTVSPDEPLEIPTPPRPSISAA